MPAACSALCNAGEIFIIAGKVAVEGKRLCGRAGCIQRIHMRVGTAGKIINLHRSKRPRAMGQQVFHRCLRIFFTGIAHYQVNQAEHRY